MNKKRSILVLGIVPARQGSKGIRNKNILPFRGKPLLVHAIECGLSSGIISRLILSTDSEDYLALGRCHGAEADHLRPARLSKDKTPMKDVVAYELDRMRRSDNFIPDVVVLLQPTQPLRRPEHIVQAFHLLMKRGADSVVSVVEVPKHLSPEYVVRIQKGELAFFHKKSPHLTRRQDAAKAYYRDGTVYIFRYSSFLKYQSIYGKTCLPLIIAPQESFNLDEENDWRILKSLHDPDPLATDEEARQKRIDRIAFDYGALPKENVGYSRLSGASRLSVICRMDRYGYPATAVICLDTGYAFLDPRPTKDAYARFYNGTYRPLVSAYHGREINGKTIQAEQKEYSRDIYKILSQFADLKAVQSLLDIGGSTGVVSQALVENMQNDFQISPHVTLLDPASDELAIGADLGFETIRGFAEDLPSMKRTWDLVLLCQTIDHVLDIPTTLDGIRAALNPKGILFVDIVDWLYVLRRTGDVSASIKIDHPHYLTIETVRAFLRSSGFGVIGEAVEKDGMHLAFVCHPVENKIPVGDSLRDYASRLYDEIRRIQALKG